MNRLKMNKGFELMLSNPKPIENQDDNYILKHELKFSIFRREIFLGFKIKAKE